MSSPFGKTNKSEAPQSRHLVIELRITITITSNNDYTINVTKFPPSIRFVTKISSRTRFVLILDNFEWKWSVFTLVTWSSNLLLQLTSLLELWFNTSVVSSVTKISSRILRILTIYNDLERKQTVPQVIDRPPKTYKTTHLMFGQPSEFSPLMIILISPVFEYCAKFSAFQSSLSRKNDIYSRVSGVHRPFP